MKSLDEYLKALEDDYTKIIHEGDIVIQDLKKKRHILNVKAYNANKEIELNKIQIKRLKRDLEFVEKKRKESDALVKNLDVEIKIMKHKVSELETKILDLKITYQVYIDEL